MDTDERIWGPTPSWLHQWLHPSAFIRGACPDEPWQRLEIRLRRATQRLPYRLAEKIVKQAAIHQGEDITAHTFPALVRKIVREDGYQGPNLAEAVVKDDAEWRERTSFGKGCPDVDPNAPVSFLDSPFVRGFGSPPPPDDRPGWVPTGSNPGWTYPAGSDHTGPVVERRRTELAATEPVSTHLSEEAQRPAIGSLSDVASLARLIDEQLCLGVYQGAEASTKDGMRDGSKRVLNALAEQVHQRDKFASDLERVSQELAQSEEKRRLMADGNPKIIAERRAGWETEREALRGEIRNLAAAVTNETGRRAQAEQDLGTARRQLGDIVAHVTQWLGLVPEYLQRFSLPIDMQAAEEIIVYKALARLVGIIKRQHIEDPNPVASSIAGSGRAGAVHRQDAIALAKSSKLYGLPSQTEEVIDAGILTVLAALDRYYNEADRPETDAERALRELRAMTGARKNETAKQAVNRIMQELQRIKDGDPY